MTTDFLQWLVRRFTLNLPSSDVLGTSRQDILHLVVIIGWFVGLIRPFPMVSLAELILIGIFLWCLADQKDEAPKFRLSSIEKWSLLGILGWFLLMFASAGFSGDFWGEGLREVFSWRKIFTCYIVAFLLVRNKLFNYLIKWQFFFAIFMGLILLVCKISGLEFHRPIQAVIENHTTQPILLLYFFTPYFVAYWAPKNIENKTLLRLFLPVGIMFLVVFYIGTSRGAFLFFIILFAMILVFFRKQIRSLFPSRLGLLMVLSFMLLTAGFLAQDRIETAVNEFVLAYDPAYDSRGASVSIRRHMWAVTFEIIKDNFWFGTGAGQFASTYSIYVEGQPDWLSRPTDDPHNSYLHIAAEHGFIAFLYALTVIASACYFICNSTKKNLMSLSYLCLVFGFLGSAMTSGHFNTFVEGRLFFLAVFLGLFLVLNKRRSPYYK